MHLRFTDAADGAPVEGVALHSPARSRSLVVRDVAAGDPLARSDADGVARLELRTWRHRGLVASKEGYGPLVVGIGPGHERRVDAYEVALEASAAVVATILGPDGSPVAGAHAELSLYSGYVARPEGAAGPLGAPRLAWGGPADDRGVVTLDGLPPRVPIEPRALSPDGAQDSGPARESCLLEPGEVREVTLTFGGLATVRGVLLDPGDVPVPGVPVWLIASGGLEPGLITGGVGGNLVGQRVTADDGTFAFGAVAVGTYAVAPEPPVEGQPATWAPIGTALEVLPGQTEVWVEARTEPALSIRGVVLGPDDVPVETSVTAFSLDRPGHAWTFAGADGRFALVGLAAGAYELTANGEGVLTDSEPTRALAGAEDVALRLLAGATLRVRLLAPDGPPENARGLLQRAGDAASLASSGLDDDGVFVADGLRPGTWDVSFTTTTGLTGTVAGVELAPGADVGPLDVALEEGARLRLTHTGDERNVFFRVRRDGVVVDFDGLLAGMADLRTVPAGDLVVEYGAFVDPAGRAEVRLAPGEERELALD